MKQNIHNTCPHYVTRDLEPRPAGSGWEVRYIMDTLEHKYRSIYPHIHTYGNLDVSMNLTCILIGMKNMKKTHGSTGRICKLNLAWVWPPLGHRTDIVLIVDIKTEMKGYCENSWKRRWNFEWWWMSDDNFTAPQNISRHAHSHATAVHMYSVLHTNSCNGVKLYYNSQRMKSVY